MSVICGIDFSESSHEAAKVAAGIASRTGQTLVLVHAVHNWPEGTGDAVFASAQAALAAIASGFRHEKVSVDARVEKQPPGVAFPRIAQELLAELVVFGQRGPGLPAPAPRARKVGSTADRLSHTMKTPALVVRSSDPFLQWLGGTRPLRVAVGAAFDHASEHAWQWVQSLARIAPIEICGIHTVHPVHELPLLGLTGLRDEPRADADAEKVIREQLARHFPVKEGQSVTWRVEPGVGSAAPLLTALVETEHCDLLVLGSHSRRKWEGSVSHAAFASTPRSVACVPFEDSDAVGAARPPKNVLVATDFSDGANAAVAAAWGWLQPGGTLHLVHVLGPGPRHDELDARDIFKPATAPEEFQRHALARLTDAMPKDPHGERTAVVHLLESAHTADAIVQAAERLGVESIFVGSRGRATLAGVLLGSVALQVSSRARLPVTVVKAPQD